MKKIKNRLFQIIQTAQSGDILSRIFDLFIITLIILNVVTVIIDTFNMPASYIKFSRIFEIISVVIFSVEYVVRVWTADLLYTNKKPYISRIKYVFSFMAIIDLLAIIPFYLPMFISVDLRILRALRIIRLFRLFKINRYTTALNSIAQVFKSKANQLISSIIIVGLLIIIASVLMYNVEHEAQPNEFSNVFQAMWWAIATLTTVGYGDIYPVTVLGKVLSTVIALLGIGLVAVPTGIITSGFSEIVTAEKDKKKYCPYCGHKVDD